MLKYTVLIRTNTSGFPDQREFKADDFGDALYYAQQIIKREYNPAHDPIIVRLGLSEA
jgi:hypothetical protein